MRNTNLPPQQLSILNRCFHPSGSFAEFDWEEVERSVSARFEKQVRLYPNNLAIKTTRQEITYRQLNRDANRVAHAILGQTGIEDRPVALLFEQGIQAVTGIFGVLKAGRAFVPLDPTYPLSRTSYMVEDVGSQLILTDGRNLPLATELASSGCQVIDIETLDSSLSIENPSLPTNPGTLAYVMYTSGSTGQAKGVTHSQRNLLHSTMRSTNVYHISPCDRLTMLFSPLSISGLRDIFRALLNGAALFPLDLKSHGISGLPDWLIQNQITIYNSVPTVYRQFLSGLDIEKGFPDLRILTLTGEPIFQNDVDQYVQKFAQDCIMINVFGSTEVSSLRWYFIDHNTQFHGNSVPVGYDFSDGFEVLIVDDHLAELGFNCIGQIAVRSRYLPGYWNRPDLAQAALLDDPDGGDLRIFLTGDLGQNFEDGCLENLGRIDSQVKVRGFRVELSEIENVLIGIDAIKEVAVVAERLNSSTNQKLIAYYVPFDQFSPTPQDLQRLLKEDLPHYTIPSAFVRLDSLPKLHGGKIDRNALPRLGQGRPDLKTPFMAPSPGIEKLLADIWAQVLQINQVGRNDDFLDLGGDSLLAAILLVHVEESFQKKLPLAALIEASTVARMAEILRHDRLMSSLSCLVTIQPHGTKSPFFCVHGEGGHVLGMTALARHLGEEQPFYGLGAAGRDGEQQPLTEIEAMAARYINELQTVQPEGPYRLGGYSMGGVIAFEMAQQLQATGQEVALLAMFDSHCPGLINAWRRRWNIIFSEIRNFHKLLKRNPATQWRLIGEKVETHVNPGSPVVHPNRGAARKYKPNPYPGKITFFWASSCPEVASDPRQGWQELAKQGMDIHRVPGDHETILTEPQLEVLAERLTACLDHALRS